MILEPERGRVVLSKAGKDKGLFMAILSCDEQYCFLANGKLRLLNNPKKKKIRHLQMTKYVLPEEILLSNRQLRKAITAISDKTGIDE